MLNTLDIPIVPIRDVVILPVLWWPINVGRQQSVRAFEGARAEDHLLGILPQRDATTEVPAPADMHEVGTLVRIRNSIEISNSRFSLVIEGLARFRVRSFCSGYDKIHLKAIGLAMCYSCVPMVIAEKTARQPAERAQRAPAK